MSKRIDWNFVKLCVVVVIFFCVCNVKCQTPTPTPVPKLHSEMHKDAIEQQDEMRFMFLDVSEKKDNLVFFSRESKNVVEVSFMFWDEQSIIKDPLAKKPYIFTGCYAALYCLIHKYIYWLERVPCSKSTGSFYFKDP